MKLNYPVKYAILEVKRHVRYEGEKTIGFVAAKCNLISEIKRHFPDGKSKMYYEVVFTWDSESYNEREYDSRKATEVILPGFNAAGCYNSCLVEAVYDDLKVCQEQADKLNENQQYKGVGYLPFDKNFSKNSKELVDNYNVELKKVKEFANKRLEDKARAEVQDPYALQ